MTRTPLVAEIQAGLVVMIANGIRASFTQVWQTHEFVGQHRRLFGFSSAALSVKFAKSFDIRFESGNARQLSEFTSPANRLRSGNLGE